VALAIFTAMRYGEIINLKWEDIDFEQGFITLKHTKNGERRIVFITPEVANILSDCTSFGNKGSIFKSKRKSTSALPLSIRKSFANALKAAKIENCRYHDLRHTAASHLAMNGATQGELMAILGHKTPTMTRRYAHYSQTHLSNLMQKTCNNLLEVK
jgi:integrase